MLIMELMPFLNTFIIAPYEFQPRLFNVVQKPTWLPYSKFHCYKLISYSGGFSSISFIKCVAEKETIEELTVSTLRIGEKQFLCLEDLHRQKKLKNANYYIGSMMADVDRDRGHGKYDYNSRFKQCCEDNNWMCMKIKNHSKIILMRTSKKYYVVETSSNLNENPQIEQYSFESSKELYEFYYNFFMSLK